MSVYTLLCLLTVAQLLYAGVPCPDPYPEPKPKLYRGYKLIQATIKNEKKKKKLLKILKNNDGVDLWKPPRGVKDKADLFMSEATFRTVSIELEKSKIKYKDTLYNATAAILDERARIRKRTFRELLHIPPVVRFSLNDFNTYTEIMAKLTDWVESCPRGMRCKLTTIGKTYEDRDIKMITLGAFPPSPKKRAIYIDCLTHAREWLSGSTCLYIINRLFMTWQFNNLEVSPLYHYDFILVPVVNPDGYVYSWDEDRMWRKNRQPNRGFECKGTDINRNFDSEWCSTPSFPSGSTYPCSDVYCGTQAGSTQEAEAIMTLMESSELWVYLDGLIEELEFAKERLIMSVSIHSYGRMWLFPWGHTENGQCAFSDSNDKLEEAANAAEIASENAEGGGNWESGTICKTIYIAPGTTADFVHKAGCEHSYTPELRGNGFIISPSQIDEAGNEAWQGIMAILEVIEQ